MPPTQKVPPRRVSSRLQSKGTLETGEENDRHNVFRVLVYPQIQSHPVEVLDENSDVRREFTFFQTLPLELREEILTLALPGPRILEFIPLKKAKVTGSFAPYDQNLTKCCLEITTPAILHVNHEYRQFAMKFYQPCFHDYMPNKSFIYMDFSQDTLLISLFSGFHSLFCRFAGQAPYGKNYLKLVQNVAVTYYLTSKYYDAINNLKYLRGLRKITKIAINGALYGSASWKQEQRDADEKLVKDWAALAGRKRPVVEHAFLDLKCLELDEFKTEFRWNGTVWH